MFMFLHRVFTHVDRLCTHVRLGVLETILCVYVCVVVEGMYKCKTSHFGNDPLCLFIFCCRGYVHM